MTRQLAVAAILIFAVVISPRATRTEPQTDVGTPNVISVRLECKKPTIPVGSPITIAVQLSNIGKEPILIPNTIPSITGYGFATSLAFDIVDAAGHRMSSNSPVIADYFPTGKKLDPTSELLGGWVLLWPGYGLTTQFELSSQEYSALAKPGRYKISAVYATSGLSDTRTLGRLGLHEEDVESLKFKSWAGRTTSNEVSVIVQAAGKSTTGRTEPAVPDKNLERSHNSRGTHRQNLPMLHASSPIVIALGLQRLPGYRSAFSTIRSLPARQIVSAGTLRASDFPRAASILSRP